MGSSQSKRSEKRKPHIPNPPSGDPPNPHPVPNIILHPNVNPENSFGLSLLGCGESGKTTLVTQLKLKYLEKPEQSKLDEYAINIKLSLIHSMQELCNLLEKNGEQVTEENQSNQESILMLDDESDFNLEIIENLKDLWEDPKIQEAFAHKDSLFLLDNIDYFFEKIDNLQDPDYHPSNDDTIRLRTHSIGIDKLTLSINDKYSTIYEIYDVAGYKNERSKWSNLLDISKGIIYCFGLSDFNKTMIENSDELRFNDALEIFEKLTHNPKLQNFPFFFIGTKMDLFTKKIKNTNAFGQSFPDYKGDIHNPEECANYIIQKFLEVAKPDSATRPIMTYKISVMNQDEVISVIADICQYIADHCHV